MASSNSVGTAKVVTAQYRYPFSQYLFPPVGLICYVVHFWVFITHDGVCKLQVSGVMANLQPICDMYCSDLDMFKAGSNGVDYLLHFCCFSNI